MNVKGLLSKEKVKSQRKFSEGISFEQFAELSARFRIWADDTGAVRYLGLGSLEYDLEFSAIISEVKRLLELLSNLLDDCKSFNFLY